MRNKFISNASAFRQYFQTLGAFAIQKEYESEIISTYRGIALGHAHDWANLHALSLIGNFP